MFRRSRADSGRAGSAASPRPAATAAPAAGRTHLAAAALLAAALLLAVFASPASAALTHRFLSSFSGPEGGFGFAQAIAVDSSTHDVYVPDPSHSRVDEFDPSGALVGTVSGPFTRPSGVAVDSSTHDLYVLQTNEDLEPAEIYEFSSTGTLLDTITAQFTAPFGGLAVDPTTGDLYAASANESVQAVYQFSPAGTQLHVFDLPRNGDTSEASAVAVDSSTHDVYAADFVQHAIDEFDSSGAFVQAISGGDVNTLTGVAVDPSSGQLYASENSNDQVFEFDSSGNLLSTLPPPPEGFANPQDVALDTSTHELYVINAQKETVDRYGPTVTVPDAHTGEATEIGAASAKLTGTINPDETAASFQFQYGQTEAYGETAPITPASVGSDDSGHEETVELTGLQPSTTYHFRIDGINECEPGEECINPGQDVSFHTFGPPSVDGSTVTSTSAVAAGIEARINPSGFDTHYRIEYGTTESYGSETPAVDVGSANVDQEGHSKLEGLDPSTTYDYRVVAENSHSPAGGNPGPNQEFTTVPPLQIESQSASTTGVCATLQAQVNPDEIDTQVLFEYGPSEAYGAETASTDIGGENTGQPVSAEVCGLTPGTAYHFRAVATNALAPAGIEGPDQTLETQPAAEIEATEAIEIGRDCATLTAQVDPEGSPTEVSFEYGIEGFGSHTAPTAIGSGAAPQTVSTEVCGLSHGPTAGTVYSFRALATNPAAPPAGITGEAREFTTLPTLLFDGLSASNLTAESVTLNARLDPLGADTTYHFEYLGETQFDAEGESFAAATSLPRPDADLGSGEESAVATQEVEGLQPETAYVFRILARNSFGEFASPAKSFTTAPPSSGPSCPNQQLRSEDNSGALPDCRAYELVTPPFKDGQPAFPGDYSPTGSSLLFSSLGAFGGAGGNSSAEGPAYLAGRGAAGWTSQSLETPLAQFRNSDSNAPTSDASRDLDKFLLERSPSSSNVADHRFYLATPGAGLTEVGPAVPPAAVAAYHPGEPAPRIQYQGGSPDLSHIVFQSVAGGGLGRYLWPGDTTVGESSLYELSGTHDTEPKLVGVRNQGPLAGDTEAELISTCGTTLGGASLGEGGVQFRTEDSYNAISADGSKVFFTAAPGTCENGTGPAVDELYARVDGSQTVDISEPSGADCAGCDTEAEVQRPATFQGASEDGSKVFFLSEQQLFSGADGEVADNLYEYDFAAPPGEKVSFLAPLLAKISGDPAGVVRVAENGSRVYFVSHAVLATNLDADGEPPVSGLADLYVYDTETLQTAFIATLSSADNRLWLGADRRQAEATPDGRYLLFNSVADLTPDASGEGRQIYRYDAASGALVRISVGDGGLSDNGNSAGYSLNLEQRYDTVDLAGPPKLSISDDGSEVFFTSPWALAPGALDHVCVAEFEVAGECPGERYASNVYEYEDGHVYLLSDGKDRHGVYDGTVSGLVGATPSGADVFLTTADSLLPSDTDGQEDVYDARVGGGFPLAVGAKVCEGDTCQGSVAPPPAGPAAATSGFQGPGNQKPKAHHKKKHRRHKRKHRRHPPRVAGHKHRGAK